MDLTDCAAFDDRATGPGGRPAQAGCGPIDFDADGDINLLDFGGLQCFFGVTHSMLFSVRDLDAGFNPQSVAIGDLDGDGNLDVATANGSFPGRVSVLLNGCVP